MLLLQILKYLYSTIVASRLVMTMMTTMITMMTMMIIVMKCKLVHAVPCDDDDDVVVLTVPYVQCYRLLHCTE